MLSQGGAGLPGQVTPHHCHETQTHCEGIPVVAGSPWLERGKLIMPMFKFFNEPDTDSASSTTATAAAPVAPANIDSAIEEKVKPIIDELRPFLQSDGGDCELLKVEDQIVYVRLVGACVGCPSSMMTLKAGVENRIREAIPEVHSVEMM